MGSLRYTLLIPPVTLLLWMGSSLIIAPSYAADFKIVVMPGIQAFTPQEIHIKLGDKVSWMNKSQEEHFLTSAGPVSRQVVKATEELEIHKLLKPGEGYTHSFAKADTYFYFCAIHNQMWGTVIVEE